MKKVLLFLVFVSFANFLFSQVSISCEGSYMCRYSYYSEEYDKDCASDNESCLFVFNENETMFRHITSDITSTYYIQGEIEEDNNSDGEDVLYFDVVSDVGNKYFVVLCLEGRYITFYKSKEYAIQYTIKSTF